MFAITSTRIVGLIAVVCAVVVAPQALAAPSTHTRIPLDAAQGDDLSGFDLKAGFHSKAAEKAAAIAALQRRSIDLEAAYRKLHPDAYRPAVQPAVQPTAQKSDTAAVWSFPVFCNGEAQALYDSGC